MAIPYQTTQFKSTNIFAMVILGPTAKFNSRQYFRLYGIYMVRSIRGMGFVHCLEVVRFRRVQFYCTTSLGTVTMIIIAPPFSSGGLCIIEQQLSAHIHVPQNELNTYTFARALVTWSNWLCTRSSWQKLKKWLFSNTMRKLVKWKLALRTGTN